jgi:hypothetical protein
MELVEWWEENWLIMLGVQEETTEVTDFQRRT